MKAVGITCALLVVSARLALALPGGLNLGWDDCGGLPASLNKAFACDTNTGTQTLVGSYILPACCPLSVVANEINMEIQSAGPTLPAWWTMRSGGCRSSSLTGNFDFTIGPFTCYDYWLGGASGGAAMDPPTIPNRARINLIAAYPNGSPLIRPVPVNTEVYTFKCIIDNQKTIGVGSCAGCATGVCIVLNSIKVVAPGGGSNYKRITWPAVRSHVSWQGGSAPDCFIVTPARNATWGSIKSLYH
jgi:hypothetical protein